MAEQCEMCHDDPHYCAFINCGNREGKRCLASWETLQRCPKREVCQDCKETSNE